MLTVSEVWQKIDALATALPAERVPLANAAGRTLREAVNAPEDQPAYDRSAIDGYAVPLGAPVGSTLRVRDRVPMGQLALDAPGPGTALKLFTGSAVPEGEIGLVKWEDVTLKDETITLLVAPSPRWIRRRASQAHAGALLLPTGTMLNAGSLALLASVGIVSPLISRVQRVAHLVTGGELLPPEAAPLPGLIRDSNSTLIAALLAASAASLVAHARAGETYVEQSAAFAALLSAGPDLILVSGGSSGGEHDHTARLFSDHGFALVVDGVAARPGKPLLVATRGAQVAIGLPGNPLSHFVCFHLFVARLLTRLSGAAPEPVLRLPLAPGAPLHVNPRETWWPATRTPEGYSPLPWADSSDLLNLSRAHALLCVPAAAAPESIAEGILV